MPKGRGGGGGRRGAGRLHVHPEALDDLISWVAEDRRIALKVLRLTEAARRTPFDGIGKPEPSKHLGSDIWSRRSTQEDRLVYRVLADGIDVLQERYHY